MGISSIRVRFAPSPTGFMHLGNVRAALMNFLFARQRQGTFILRIEDTDIVRNIAQGTEQILADLAWLGLTFDEGPVAGGPHAPYFQSERASLYKEHLAWLEMNHHIYHCFCTAEELEKKRQRQIDLKMPPRYDRTCYKLSPEQIGQKLAEKTPFIWRFKLEGGVVEIVDLARGKVRYDLKNFADFPLTRADGTFTFIFANFVDDMVMKITHVMRGEDHLTNTAVQVALYNAFNMPIPTFWHLPIICNAEGKKLSKRDFGFSLTDLRNAGFLPEAICNYLAIIGASFEHEVMSLDELIRIINFETLASTGQIRYDLDKLKWLNHKWINRLDARTIALRSHVVLADMYPAARAMTMEQITALIAPLQGEITTLNDVPRVLAFYFEEPSIDQALFVEYRLADYAQLIFDVINRYREDNFDAEQFVQEMTRAAKEVQAPIKNVFALLRIALTGKPQGPAVKDVLKLLPVGTTIKRLQKLL